MRLSNATKEISVGAIVSIGVVIFAVAVMAISKESRLFVPKVRYWTQFSNTSGLTEGSPVRLVGVQIGTVEIIEFPEDIKEPRIRVEFNVAREYSNRIRVDSLAYLKSLTYLSQEKYIELTPGEDPAAPVLDPGGFIEAGTSIWEATMERGRSIADDVKDVTAALRDLLVAVNTGEGLFKDMIHNPEFGREGLHDLQSSLSSLRKVLSEVESGKGLAGTLVMDEKFAGQQREHIDASLRHLRAAMERLDDEEGFLAQLTDPDGHASKALADLEESAAAFRKAADNLAQGDGLVGRLLNDEKYAEDLLDSIRETVSHAKSIVGKIDRGEGTLGGIINDPDIHEDLKDVVAGIRKSRLGKGVLRHYGKKGAKSREKQAEEEGATIKDEEDGDGSSDWDPSP